MTLKEWVSSVGGGTAAARLLRVTPGAVSKWLNEGRTPEVLTMVRIVKLANSDLSIERILKEVEATKKRRERLTR